MSAVVGKKKSAATRLAQLVVLVALVAMFMAVSQVRPMPEGSGVVVAATGLLLLCGLLTSELLEPFRRSAERT